jgi:hypothetical protein
MFQARKAVLILITALFVFAFAGLSYADDIDGLTSGVEQNTYVNPGGLGQALIYNYYNTRGNVTYFTVVNTDTANGVRVRLRFREGADVENSLCSDQDQAFEDIPLGSFEVFDFDICLSAGDMWTGHIMDSDLTGGAMLCADDVDTLVWDNVTSDIFENVFAFSGGCAQFKFGADNPVSGITADHTREGYFEIIAENLIDAEPDTCDPDEDDSVNNSQADNVLFGNAAIIEQTLGSTYTYNATALADWTTQNEFSPLTTAFPTLNDGDETIIGVNYALAKEQLYSIYDLIGAETSHVVTLPTKLLTFQFIGCDNDLFADLTTQFTIWSPDERFNEPQGCSGSPCVGAPEAELPFEVNVITIGANNILTMGGAGASTLTALPAPFDFGWINVNMNVANPAHSNPSAFVSSFSEGWPALGLTLLNIDGGASVGTFPMQYSTNVGF